MKEMTPKTPKLDKLTWKNVERHRKSLYKAAIKAEKEDGMTYRQFLDSLSDDDLGIFITIQTIYFGRTLEDSVKNAKCHLTDRDNAIRTFTSKDPEKDLGNIAA